MFINSAVLAAHLKQPERIPISQESHRRFDTHEIQFKPKTGVIFSTSVFFLIFVYNLAF